MVLEVLETVIREEKEINSNWKGSKLSLFAGDVILYIENPKDATRELLELIMNSVKFQDIKLIHRNLLRFYTLATKDQKEKLRK